MPEPLVASDPWTVWHLLAYVSGIATLPLLIILLTYLHVQMRYFFPPKSRKVFPSICTYCNRRDSYSSEANRAAGMIEHQQECEKSPLRPALEVCREILGSTSDLNELTDRAQKAVDNYQTFLDRQLDLEKESAPKKGVEHP